MDITCTRKNPDGRVDTGSDANADLMAEGSRIGKEIIKELKDSENLWMTISEKQAMIHCLYGEQIKVSDKFSRYNQLWINRDYTVSENIESFHRFNEIDEQVQLLSQYLYDFESKLIRSGGIVKDLIREMKNHITLLRKSMEMVTGASCMEDLNQITIPSLEWTEEYPDPEIQTLLDEWEQLQLDARITESLSHLEEMVPVHDNEDLAFLQDNDIDIVEESN